MFVEYWNDCAAKSVNRLVIRVHINNSDRAPRISNHIVDAGSQYSSGRYSDSFFDFLLKALALNGVIPEDSNVLRVHLEQRMIYQVPGSWLTTCP